MRSVHRKPNFCTALGGILPGRAAATTVAEDRMITLLLADDDPNVLLGLRMRLALEADLRVVGEATNGADAVELAARLRPDVVVLDIQMPGIDGIAAARALTARDPRMGIVVLSIHDDA